MAKKSALRQKLIKDQEYEKHVNEIEKKRKAILKGHIGYQDTTGKTREKEIEKTQEFKDWKSGISAEYNQKINDVKESLAGLYLEEKQKALDYYPIFMAIAEKIGYDAAGKSIPENELDAITPELARFIEHIEKNENI